MGRPSEQWAGTDDDGINGVDDLGEVGLGDDSSPADIFVTNFTNANWLYLNAPTIGMRLTDNVDAIDVEMPANTPFGEGPQMPLDDVPEPATFFLAVLGMLGLVFLRRRE